ncbi:ABC-three component system middle component 1 [Cobetia crustatorum]|uniref:ABC-three component system middle component 1 n=1 Tax=Cobetia crustatorum TaxID=553385 RepID=UPI000468453C|nr:ABC-three component system middle component 1 [Cobetia crustatorum]
MLKISEMTEAILKRAEGRYEVNIPDTFGFALPPNDVDSATVQLKRIGNEGAGWRTVLIAAFPFDLAKIQSAFRWGADIRDLLPEPQIADLYMFMLIESISQEDAARLEADDRFCRKIVAREPEDVDSFLDRSFLAILSPIGRSDTISDPLLASLSSLGREHSWVVPHLDTWRELLLSGKSGGDIAEDLKISAFSDEESQ